MRNRILGIDPGTRTVGYGLVDLVGRDGLEYVECGIIRPSPTAPVVDRLHEIAEGIADVIREFSPGTLALERAFHGVNAASAIKLGEARGTVMLVGKQHGLGVHEYAPTHIKRAVVGKGRATKEDVQQRVALLCGLRRTPSTDAADALAIALCHAQQSFGGYDGDAQGVADVAGGAAP